MTEAETDAALIAAALRLAAAEGWSRVTVAAAARAAEVPLTIARERFPARQTILLRLGRMADQAVLAEVPTDGSVRDRLFDLLMRRLDAFQAHRDGVIAILRALPCDPPTAIMLACATRRSMRWMLEAAGVRTTGLVGELRVRGLLGVWLIAIRAWERDASDDLSTTMAVLDKALTRAEQMASWLGRDAGPRTPPADPEPPAEPEPPAPETVPA
jgi:AcrR family transcriptional regulator